MNHGVSMVSWLWRLPVCASAYVVGSMISFALMPALGVALPMIPSEMGAPVDLLLLSLAGGLVMAAGLASLAVGLTGRRWERWLALTAFGFIINGVGNALETSIFTTLGGEIGAALATLPAFALSALAIVYLFPGPEGSLTARARRYFRKAPTVTILGRMTLAVLAFPVIYFLVGIIIAPIVTPHYDTIDFLVLPPITTIVPVLLLRSLLLLLASVAFLSGWSASRSGLFLGLSLGHAATVGVASMVVATFFPLVLRWTHGLEILVDSMLYAAVLVRLFHGRPDLHAGELAAAETAGGIR